ncbi:MAG TPA: hypothetical protein VGJ38_02635 [Jatrophihabitantaceae bacterium]|jgi:hypothetical protein
MNDIEVRGNATADELAAVMAALKERPAQDDRYERWRRGRIAAVANRDHLVGSGHSDT